MTKSRTSGKNQNKVQNVLIFAVVAVLLFVGFHFNQQYLRYVRLGDELDGYRQQLALAEAEYASLCEQRDLLQTDSYIEYIARKNLGMVMQGEKLVQASVYDEAVAVMDKDFNSNDYIH